MANKEINDLTNKATPESTDEVEIQETAGGDSYKSTLANLAKGHTHSQYLPVDGSMPMTGILALQGFGIEDLGTVADVNSNEVMTFSHVNSAVNYLDLLNAATGNEVELTATGSDTNVGLTINTKGSGTITLGGTLNLNSNDLSNVGDINSVTAPTAQYTTAEETKLAAIEALADVTDATNVAAAGALMDSDFLDQDDFADATSTSVASGESIKAYVDDAVMGELQHVYDETPTGTIDGTNDDFVTASDYVSGTLQVYLNGVRLEAGVGNDFTESGGDDFVMLQIPQTGDKLVVDYMTANTETGNASTLGGESLSYVLDAGNHTNSPYNPYAFRATFSKSFTTATQTVVNSGWTEVFDPSGDFNSSGEYTAPYDGYYLFTAHAGWANIAASGRAIIWIYANGANSSTTQVDNNSGTTDTSVSTSALVYLAAGQHAEVQAYQSDGTTLTGTGHFSGFLVHRT